jgi:hypothetical protein
VRFFDAATGAETRRPLELAAPPAAGFLPAVSVAISGDGQYVAVGNERNPDLPEPAFELIWDLEAPASQPATITYGMDSLPSPSRPTATW